jgi:universal stress protein A
MKTKEPPLKRQRRALHQQKANHENVTSISVPPRFNSPFRIKSILVPIDFSAASKKALKYAVPFAEQFGAKLTLLHVVEPLGGSLAMENDEQAAACKSHLEMVIKRQAINPALLDKTLIRQGRSFHEIANAARTLKVDLIIISTHGYTGLKHVFMGSTAERVVRHAPCPVLVVRENEHEILTN